MVADNQYSAYATIFKQWGLTKCLYGSLHKAETFLVGSSMFTLQHLSKEDTSRQLLIWKSNCLQPRQKSLQVGSVVYFAICKQDTAANFIDKNEAVFNSDIIVKS